MSVVGSRGSYRKTNPQLSQAVESLKIICKSLNQSKRNWWLSPSTVQSIKEMKSSRFLDGLQEENDDSDNDGSCGVEENDNDDDEMIDLQATDAGQSCLSEDTDGIISEDESVELS